MASGKNIPCLTDLLQNIKLALKFCLNKMNLILKTV